MDKKLIIGFMLVLLIFPFVNSAAVQVNTAEGARGLQIFYPEYDYVKLDSSFNLTVYVGNISTGLTFKNTEVDCHLDLYGSDGGHILHRTMLSKHNSYEHQIFLTTGNFSTEGLMSFNIDCNRTTYGGMVNGVFEVNRVGSGLTSGKAILYVGLFGILVGVFLVTFFGIGMLPSKNTADEEGKIMSISLLKYLRSTLWMFEWFLLLAIIFIGSNLAFAYLVEEMFANFLFMFFQVGLAISPIITIVWISWIFVKIFYDKQLQDLFKRGLHPALNTI